MGNKICGGTATKNEQPDDDARVQETLDSLFPNFKPLTKDCPKWQQVEGAQCPECVHDFDFLTFREHCRSCGRIFCSRCCYPRKAIHNHCICGICMGAAIRALREREISRINTRMRSHSQLLRERRSSTMGGVKEAPGIPDDGTHEEMAEVKACADGDGSKREEGADAPAAETAACPRRSGGAADEKEQCVAASESSHLHEASAAGTYGSDCPD